MEKNLSKELLLQNLNSENSFVSNACLKQIFDELLQGKHGKISIKDILFTEKSNFSAEEFLKMLAAHFLQIPQKERNMQKWDNFFNVLEQRNNIPIARRVVLNLYLNKNLNREEKHRCCFWLNNHCQLGNHETLVLKMLSYPEDGKLLLLASKYIAQEYSPSKQELEKVCSLPLRISRKMDVYSLFIRQQNQKYNFAILASLIKDFSNSPWKIDAEENARIWKQILQLLQNNPLDEISEDLAINIDTFSKLYQENKINTDIYLDILDAYARQITLNITNSQKILNGYYQVLIVENKQDKLPRIKEMLFSLLEKKNPRISDQILSMMLKMMILQEKDKQFIFYHMHEFKAKVYKHVTSIKKVKVSVLKQCLQVDENIFLLLLGKNVEGDMKSILKEVLYDYPAIWDDSIDAIFSEMQRNMFNIMKIIAELYESCQVEEKRTMLLSTLQKLINNMPEKESVVAKAENKLSFMSQNAELKGLVDTYLKLAQEPMANYLIG